MNGSMYLTDEEYALISQLRKTSCDVAQLVRIEEVYNRIMNNASINMQLNFSGRGSLTLDLDTENNSIDNVIYQYIIIREKIKFQNREFEEFLRLKEKYEKDERK